MTAGRDTATREAAGRSQDGAATGQVRELLENWAQAVRAHDIERVLAHHTPDVVMFDVPPPEQWRGIKAYRESWELFFRNFPRQGGVFDIDGLEITANGDLAYGFGVIRCGSRDDTFPVRLTVCLSRVGGAWTIAHEHHSVPASE